MTVSQPLQPSPDFIKLLANDLRWSLLKALTIGDFQVNELVEQLRQPMNLVSYHLKKMRDDGLVSTRRSEADARDVYYTLELDRLRQGFHAAGSALHPALMRPAAPPDSLPLRRQRVLFVCTHNSARSQMAEGILRHLSHAQLDVSSAGSHPTAVHPAAISTLRRFDIDISHQRARSLAEFADHEFDYVITVCDRAREVCPTFPGSAQQLHWGFADPLAVDDERRRADLFDHIARRLFSRIGYFVSTLPASSPESES